MTNYEKSVHYLWFGYLPDGVIPEWIFECLDADIEKYLPHTPANVIKLLDDIFSQIVESYTPDDFVVPLSGGWDSRLILAALMKHVPKSKIRTITFGSPGSLDFEVGRYIANELNVSYTLTDLNEVSLNWELLHSIAQKASWTFMPDAFFNHQAYYPKQGENNVILTGFMGDPLAGSHLGRFSEFATPDEINQIFIKSQKRRIRSLDIPEPSFGINNLQMVRGRGILLNDLIDIGIRQRCCIAPITRGLCEWSGWGVEAKSRQQSKILTPFTDMRWAKFWLTAPVNLRKNQFLYLQSFSEYDAKIFFMPCKARLGLTYDSGITYALRKKVLQIQNVLHRNMPGLFARQILNDNYLNFETAYQSRQFKELLDHTELVLGKKLPELSCCFKKLKDSISRNHYSGAEDFNLFLGLSLNLCEDGDFFE
jgi:hypothetical protein